MSNFMEIRPVGTRENERRMVGRTWRIWSGFFWDNANSRKNPFGGSRADKRTNIPRLSVALCKCFANVSKIKICATIVSYGQYSLLFENPRLWGLTVLNVAFHSFLYSFQGSVASFKMLGSSLFINNHTSCNPRYLQCHNTKTVKKTLFSTPLQMLK
jgi:hypothetical protein